VHLAFAEPHGAGEVAAGLAHGGKGGAGDFQRRARRGGIGARDGRGGQQQRG